MNTKVENSNGDFLREGGKRGRKKKIKKRIHGVYRPWRPEEKNPCH